MTLDIMTYSRVSILPLYSIEYWVLNEYSFGVQYTNISNGICYSHLVQRK